MLKAAYSENKLLIDQKTMTKLSANLFCTFPHKEIFDFDLSTILLSKLLFIKSYLLNFDVF